MPEICGVGRQSFILSDPIRDLAAPPPIRGRSAPFPVLVGKKKLASMRVVYFNMQHFLCGRE